MNDQEINVSPLANKKRSIIFYVITALVTAAVTFTLTAGAGLLLWRNLGRTKPDPAGSLTFPFELAADPATEASLQKLKKVYEAVNDNYYEELSDADLIEAMTRGLVNELKNPYTFYLTAEENEQIEESMSGHYSGIGAVVALNKDGLVEVVELIEGGPAEASGIRAGDLFAEVDGQDVTGFNDINAVAALVRGPENTTVDLVLYRPALNERLSFVVERKDITSASVSYRMLDKDIGYIQVKEFSQNVAANFKTALTDLKERGARHLVIDLRNNSGGLAGEVIEMLDYLLPKTVIATIKGRNDGQPFSTSWQSSPKMLVDEDMRYSILVNGFSASASELFAGCLHDLDKAYLVGEQTFGKGSGTITITLADKSAINLTNFLYYLPNGESIEGVGLQPDQEVLLPEEVRGMALSSLSLDQDTQLAAALDWLNLLD